MLRAAVIGVGYLGKFHAEKFARNQRAELVAVVDTDESVARKVGKKWKAAPLTNYEELLDLNIDCVSVATPTTTHHKIGRWLLTHGIDLLIEKPFTVTCDEARELIALAETHDRIIQVGHLERFNPAFQAVKDRLQDPRFFEVRRIAPFTGRGSDVDVVRDLMIHDIDIVNHLVGCPIKRVEAIGTSVLTERVDIANARLTFESGTVANVSASRAAFSTERTIRIFQPDLYISLDFGKKRLKICSKGDGTDALGLSAVKVEEQKVEERDALADEIDSFLQSVATRQAPAVSGTDGLKALELAERIEHAFAESAAAFRNSPVAANA